jgi:hypothetical protein
MMAPAFALVTLLVLQPGPAIIRGTVVDARTSAPVADAQVMLVDLGRSVRTTADGRFEFNDVKPGTHTLTVSTIGYIFVRRQVPATVGVALSITIPLAEGTGTYQETVTVSADIQPPSVTGVSSQMELGSAALADLRGVAADDPMRAIQALPGVATGDDFQAEFSVRGSAFRHAGVVVDGTATAMLHSIRGREDTGSVAMVNTDVLSRAALFAGPHPRRHGDWLGPTLEFDMREGSRDRAGFRGAVSGTSASMVVEGPLGRGKRGSWLVSTRKSYIDWLIRKLEPEIDSTIGFSDAQAKVVYDLTSRQQAQLLIIGGTATYREDQPSFANGLKQARSDSGLMSAAWRYATSRVVVTHRLSLVGNDFDNRGVLSQELGRGFSQAVTARLDVAAMLSRGWTLDAGARHERFRMSQTLRDFTTVNGQLRLRAERGIGAMTTLWSGWAEVGRRGPAGGVSAGFRLADRTLASEGSISPWIVGERAFGKLTLRGGAGLTSQYPDPLLTEEFDPGPVLPERARSFDVSGEYRLPAGMRLTVTGFHRRETRAFRPVGEDRIDPQTGKRIQQTPFPVFLPTIGGTSRGADITLMRRSASGLSGWAAYTWAHTEHRDTVTGEAFDADYDQRHTLNVVAQHRLSYRLSVSAKLRMGSNMPVIGYFAGTPDALRLGSLRNQVRLPYYTRLDVRANRTFTFERKRLTLFLEVMNLMGRRNYGQADGAVRTNFDTVNFVERLIPFVPSIGMLIEF